MLDIVVVLRLHELASFVIDHRLLRAQALPLGGDTDYHDVAVVPEVMGLSRCNQNLRG